MATSSFIACGSGQPDLGIRMHTVNNSRDEMLLKVIEHLFNEEVRRKIQTAIGEYDELNLVRKRKLRWFGLVSGSFGLAKTIL